LTIGDEAYKRNFGATPREMRSGLGALSWRGSPHVAIDCAKSYAREKVGAISGILARPAVAG
jgi:CelD/BcsL family acetyltransferase involved in cellulose biosynthesis